MAQDIEGAEIKPAKGKTQVWRDGKLIVDNLEDGKSVPTDKLINEPPTQEDLDRAKARAEAVSKKAAAKAAASKKQAGR